MGTKLLRAGVDGGWLMDGTLSVECEARGTGEFLDWGSGEGLRTGPRYPFELTELGKWEASWVLE